MNNSALAICQRNTAARTKKIHAPMKALTKKASPASAAAAAIRCWIRDASASKKRPLQHFRVRESAEEKPAAAPPAIPR